jgi:hypothetical protein
VRAYKQQAWLLKCERLCSKSIAKLLNVVEKAT